MPISVQLPGYNHAAPGVGLAQVIGEGVSAYKNYQQGKAADIQNQRNSDAFKQANDQSSPVSEFSRQSAMADLGTIAKSKVAQAPDTQAGLARMSDMIKNGVMSKDPQSGQIVNRPLSAIEVNNVYSENPFIKGMHDQMNNQLKADSMLPLYQSKKDLVDVQKGRLEETRNQNAASAGQKFEDDPIIKASKGSVNSLTRSVSILDNPNKPVTNKDLNLAYNDYINAVANGGAATEGKIARELPETWEQSWNEIKQKAGTNDDLRKNPSGAALIDMLRENIHTVNKDLKGAISGQAQNVADSFGQNSNPKVKATVQQKLKSYAAPAESAPPQSGGPGGAMTLEEFMKAKGK